jgi:hypothetical protein
VYGDLTDLPRVGAAVLRAEAMLVAPTWWRRVSRSAPRAGAVEEIPEITVGHGPADASTQDAPPNPVTTGSQVPTQRSASAESTQEPGRSNQR